MATAKTSVGVATTNNAAKDDYFTGLDWLVEDGKAGNGSLRGALNVLANDPGSAKIVGWSDSLPVTQAQLTGHGALFGGKVQVAVNAQGQLDVDASGLNAELQSLGAGESREFSFYYTAQMANGAYSSAKVTFVVQGTNDAPVVSGASMLSGVVTDTAADDSFATVTGKVVATDVDSNDAGKLAFALAPGEDGLSPYGTFKLNADGTWSFVTNDAAVEALKTNVVETFDILVSDAHGGSTATKVTVTLAGSNDTAEIGGTGTGAAAEDGAQTTGGTLTVSDRDSGDTGFKAPASAALKGSYGAFTFDPATGAWTYTLDNAAAQKLGASSVVHETLKVASADGSASTTIDVTVTGANDAPTVSATSTLTGTLADTAADDTFAVLTGKVVGSDIDMDDATLTYAAAPGQSSPYGTFAVDAAGNWSFTPDDAAVEGLKTSVTETFTVIVADGHGGSAPATVSVTLAGTNDKAEFSGTVSGAVAEDGTASAGGTVTVSDRDSGDIGFQPVAPAALQGSYGSFTFDPATGAWTYALDNGSAAVQSLGVTSIVHDELVVTSADGSASTTIDVTIAGANDAPTVSATSTLTGTIVDTYDDDGFFPIGGQVVASDIDTEEYYLTYTAAPGQRSDYGRFFVDTFGHWTFTPRDAAIEALKTSVTETFTVIVSDGHGGSTNATVSITLAGANDIAELSGTVTGSAAEDGAASAGGIVTVSDRDAGDNGFQPVAPAGLQGSYGAFTFDPASGAWTYALDNAAAQKLGASSVVHETLTVTSADGSAATTIDVTVTGANDAPAVSATSTLTGTVTDGAGDDSFAAVGGQVVGGDIDLDDVLLSYSAAPGQSSAYGLFAVDSSGHWTFTANDSAVEGLKTNVTETFSVTVSDGHGGSANATVSVDLAGANDMASISGSKAGAVAEDGVLAASGSLSVADRDFGDVGFQAATAAQLQGTYGTFSFNAATGAWSYALANSSAAVQGLQIGQVVSDSLTVLSADGSASETIVVKVTGAYDSPGAFAGTGDPNDFDGQAAGAAIVVGPGGGNSPPIHGTAGADIIGNSGNVGNNTIWAGAGNDVINAGIGNDTVYAGSGNDIVNGDAQNDTLFGGSGNDIINGADGNDLIYGGYGADQLNGGNGNDTFYYLSRLDGGDTITGFGNGNDHIDLTALGVTGFAGLLTEAGAVGAHQVGYMSSGGVTTLYVDTDGVFGADMEINLAGYVPHAADFVLAPVVP